VDDHSAYVTEPRNAALRDAGVPIRLRRWSDDAIRAALARLWAHTGRPPVSEDLWSDARYGPAAASLRRRYGGVTEAWELLGPVPSA
jgi:hypothetical protein